MVGYYTCWFRVIYPIPGLLIKIVFGYDDIEFCI